MRPRRFLLLVVFAILAWCATGIFVVQPDELGLVRRAGRLLEEVRQPGLHWGLPLGIDRIERVKPREVRRVLVGGVRLAGEAAGAAMPQLLTGDRNLVNVIASIQYVIADPQQFVRQRDAIDRLTATAGEASLSEVIAVRGVDRLLTQGKAEAAQAVRDELQQLVDRCGLGITIRSVDLGSIEPPPEVADSFAAVVAAQRERDQSVNLANSYADQVSAQSKADAQRLLDSARSLSDRAIRNATGDSDRFLKLLAEYQRSPELTGFRLYQEAMAEILPRLKSKLIVDQGQAIDLSVFTTESPRQESNKK